MNKNVVHLKKIFNEKIHMRFENLSNEKLVHNKKYMYKKTRFSKDKLRN